MLPERNSVELPGRYWSLDGKKLLPRAIGILGCKLINGESTEKVIAQAERSRAVTRASRNGRHGTVDTRTVFVYLIFPSWSD